MAEENEQTIDIRSKIVPILPLLVGLAALLIVAGGVTLIRSLTSKKLEEPKQLEITQDSTETTGFTYVQTTPTPQALGLKLPETTDQASPSPSVVTTPVEGTAKGLPATGSEAFVFGLISASAVGAGFLFRKLFSKI